MSQISIEIGSQIRHIRKKNKMTLADLSKLVNKNIATISKYEKGDIIIDIETLYEISEALNVPVEQLLYHEQTFKPSAKGVGIPHFFCGVSQFYSYIYDGRNSSIIPCVFDVISEIENGTYRVNMYMNFKSYDYYQQCENTYTGYIRHFDAMTYISLVNRDTAMEEASIQILASYLDSDTKYGLFNGFSSRPMMPIAIKMLFSKDRLEQNADLEAKLRVSRNDIKMMKLYNMFSVV